MKHKKHPAGFTQINTVILNLFQDLQRSLLSFLNGMRGRFQIKFGMTPLFNNGAFTLIELLVVVLIIGILAAIAVPQYQLAVDKARLGKLLSMVQAVKKAQIAYELENGTLTDNWNDLTLSFPGTINGSGTVLTSDEGWELRLSKTHEGTGAANAVTATDSLLPDVTIYNFYRNGNVWGEHLACYASSSSTRAKRLCKSATGKSTPDKGSGSGTNTYDVYFFN